ncbi:hypothetical protein [Paeniglutamicibacter sp.]|uniref:hypothetical protein n=1 Tax=Paeniglutamicibacter sp. TaxID=1934391 RepID=UPI0039894EC2
MSSENLNRSTVDNEATGSEIPGYAIHDVYSPNFLPPIVADRPFEFHGDPGQLIGQLRPWPEPEPEDWVIIIHDEPGGRELLKIFTDGTVSGAIEDAGPAAERFVADLRGLTEAIRAQAFRDAAAILTEKAKMP